MAYELNLQKTSLIASSDFSSSQYYAVALDSNGQAALAGAGVNAIGIMQDKPVVGKVGGVAYAGISKAVAGAAIAAGAAVMTDSTGKLITATSTNYVVGEAVLAASGTGIIFSVLLRPGGKV